MLEAYRLISWSGHGTDEVSAASIKSKWDSLEKGPFLDSKYVPVYWASGVYTETYRRRSCFRHWPGGASGKRIFPPWEEAERERARVSSESAVHRKAKESCATALRQLLAEGEPLPWGFKNPDVSDFPLKGNLLSEVTNVEVEYSVKTPFGSNYRFDIALLAKGTPFGKDLILGAIEFEFSNPLTIWKTAVCKTMGFPIVTVDLEQVSEADITPEWVLKILTETTKTHAQGRRRNFIFVHPLLYPAFLEIPKSLRPTPVQRLLVFTSDDNIEKIQSVLSSYRKKLALPNDNVLLQPNRGTNLEAQKQCRNAGSIAGKNWAEYNPRFYLRITLSVLSSTSGPLYLFYLQTAALLAGEFECLVGYKPTDGVGYNDDPENPIWPCLKDGRRTTGKIAQKSLSSPLRPLRRYLDAVATKNSESLLPQ